MTPYHADPPTGNFSPAPNATDEVDPLIVMLLRERATWDEIDADAEREGHAERRLRGLRPRKAVPA